MAEKWIAGAIKRPGALKAAAKRRGTTVSGLIAHPPRNASTRLKLQIALAKRLRGFQKHKRQRRE